MRASFQLLDVSVVWYCGHSLQCTHWADLGVPGCHPTPIRTRILDVPLLDLCLHTSSRRTGRAYYNPPMKLREGNVFTSVCLFTGGGSVCGPGPLQGMDGVGMPGPRVLSKVGGYKR